MALAHCILGKFLGVGCHCFPLPLDVPTFSARCLNVKRRKRPLAAEGGTLRGREMFRQISSRIQLPCNSRDLLHAVNLRDGTDGFTSPASGYIVQKCTSLLCYCWCTSLTRALGWGFIPNYGHHINVTSDSACSPTSQLGCCWVMWSDNISIVVA
jgi:hypothetical protein